jgi:hypothetical protein
VTAFPLCSKVDDRRRMRSMRRLCGRSVTGVQFFGVSVRRHTGRRFGGDMKGNFSTLAN